MRLEGKTALITGAASGIGATAAERFVSEGCRVCLCDIQVEQGQTLAEKCGNGSIFQACDVTDESAVAAAVDAAVEEFGHLLVGQPGGRTPPHSSATRMGSSCCSSAIAPHPF